MNKYYARKTECNQGHLHDSKKESFRCNDLTLMVKARVISNLTQQPNFTLQEGFRYKGKWVRKISYKADFSYFDNVEKKQVIEDTKGYKTEVYRIKKKMFLKTIADNDDLEFIES